MDDVLKKVKDGINAAVVWRTQPEKQWQEVPWKD